MLSTLILSINFFACEVEPDKITDDTGLQTSELNVDADEDGVPEEEDCDDSNPDVSEFGMYYPDGDGDGYGDEEAGEEACGAPEGFIEEAGDCDDSNPDANDTTFDADCDAVETVRRNRQWCSLTYEG